jgi:hypothetical protein
VYPTVCSFHYETLNGWFIETGNNVVQTGLNLPWKLGYEQGKINTSRLTKECSKVSFFKYIYLFHITHNCFQKIMP